MRFVLWMESHSASQLRHGPLIQATCALVDALAQSEAVWIRWVQTRSESSLTSGVSQPPDPLEGFEERKRWCQEVIRYVRELQLKSGRDAEVSWSEVVQFEGEALRFLVDQSQRFKSDFVLTPAGSTHKMIEGLVQKTQLPLVVLPEGVCADLDFSKILFPTDLTLGSLRAFDQVVPIAKRLNAKVTLFSSFRRSKLGRPLSEPVRAEELEKSFSPLWQSELQKVRKEAETLLKYIQGRGVEVDLFLDASGIPVLEAAGKLAQRDAYGLMAFRYMETGLSSWWRGETLRQVIRSSTVPLWAIHASMEEKTGPLESLDAA